MTANWPPPGTQPLPGTQPPPGLPQAPPGYGYNWGLAYPVGYQPVSWIPRPPRPAVVKVAVIFTMVGVLVSAIQLVINMVYAYQQRGQIVTQVNTGTAADADIFNTAVVVGLAFGVVFWLLPAAGAVVTALLAQRGSNAARIVLASLMGLFALNDLCNGVFGLVSPGFNVSAVRAAGISPAFNLVLAALAVAIGVLVLVPPANRFFSPGPGRRFMTSN
jgi:CubicO group peptidase (beta-lactamase class C family)